MNPACAGRNPRLFDSLSVIDHLQARRVCAGCPMVTACVMRAVDIANTQPKPRSHRSPDGTWGGLLWHNGKVVDVSLARLKEAAA